MKRRLVRLVGLSSFYAEVDNVRLKREAQELLVFIKTHIDPNNDEHGIWASVVPLCKNVIGGVISLPIPFSELPLGYEMYEGLLPSDFEEVFAEFKLTISGSPREILDKLVIDGIRYMYVDFEE